MKLITREIDYAVRAITYLAEKEDGVVSVIELVNRLGITRPFLRKIMQVLAKSDIVDSYKGYRGGFRLVKKPENIYLIELVEIFQGKFSLNECLLNKNICPDQTTCLLKERVNSIEKKVKEELEAINMRSLIRKR